MYSTSVLVCLLHGPYLITRDSYSPIVYSYIPVLSTLRSTCLQVENVEGVSLPPVRASAGNVVFNETIDHSKWALTAALSSSRSRLPSSRCSAPNGGACADLVYPNRNANGNGGGVGGRGEGGKGGGEEPAPWVCVGDINREYTQYKRPGGQLCILHAGVHETYLKSVAVTERCAQREPSRPRRPSRNML